MIVLLNIGLWTRACLAQEQTIKLIKQGDCVEEQEITTTSSPRALPRALTPMLGEGNLFAAVPSSTPAAPDAPAQPEGDKPNQSALSLPFAEHFRMQTVEFEGNTAFSDAELMDAVRASLRRNGKPFLSGPGIRSLNCDLTADDLETMRRYLTQFYINAGFINSGALLKHPRPANGVVTFILVEGRLTDIQIVKPRYFRPRYLTQMLAQGAAPPFNYLHTRDVLEMLRQSPNIKRIQAEVQPGARPGEALLQVAIEENSPYTMSVEFNNYRPTTVGPNQLRLTTASSNLTGQDDTLIIHSNLNGNGLNLNHTANPHDFSLAYTSPLNRLHNRLMFDYAKSDTSVIEAEFRSLGISSSSENFSLGITHQLRRSLTHQVGLTVLLEHRKSLTFLSGIPFSFSSGDDNGKAQTTALRIGYDSVRRNATRVLALRTLLSYDSDFPGSTHHQESPAEAPQEPPVEAPDGRFLTLLQQVQYVQFIGKTRNQLLLRCNAQWSNRPLLSVEQFPLGGINTVRGYPENQLVRDQAITASAELRLPINNPRDWQNTLILVPFTDFGYGINKGQPSIVSGTELHHLNSAGLGIIYSPSRHFSGQVYYGYRLRRFNSFNHDLQNKGIHFSILWNLW